MNGFGFMFGFLRHRVAILILALLVTLIALPLFINPGLYAQPAEKAPRAAETEPTEKVQSLQEPETPEKGASADEARTELGRLLSPTLEVPSVVFPGMPFSVAVHIQGIGPQDSLAYVLTTASGRILREGLITEEETVIDELTLLEGETRQLILTAAGFTRTTRLHTVPGFFSILPPLLAIILAIVTRQVVVSLFLGIWLGATFIYGYNPVTAFLRTIDTYAVSVTSESSHVAIILFSLLLGGMVGIISKSGGTRGIVEATSSLATSPRRGQLATWVMGVVIFFDDYANTLIVGNTMRPVTDKLRVSREKLAYIVDATAAPIASIAIISTWVGYEVGLIADSFTGLNISENAYLVFIKTIPFRFYPLLALVLGFAVAITGRDFGPMLRAERRARIHGKPLADKAVPLADFDSPAIRPDEGIKARWYNAMIPIAIVIAVTLIGLYTTGRAALEPSAREGARFQDIIGEADPYASLLWASFLGCISALLLGVSQRLLSIGRAIEAWLSGIKSMMLAIIILILAWSIGAICRELHTADFVVQAASGTLSPYLIPAVIFAISACISFATGTSWGTMAIIMPIAVPLAYKLPLEAGVDPGHQYGILLGGIGSVLAGAVFGDHCSPISDTTIMSSMASACDHIDHVRTQLPYALLAGIIGIIAGDIPTAYGLSPWVSLVVGSLVILVVLRLFASRAYGNA